jgi:hypothetical protein
MNLYYILYSSTPTRQLSDLELEDLLYVARTENGVRYITGMLLCFSNMYIQLIEGPEIHIHQLYRNIRNDSRHYEVTTLKEGVIEKRFFSDWTMGYDKSESSFDDTRISFDLADEKSFRLLNILNIR